MEYNETIKFFKAIQALYFKFNDGLKKNEVEAKAFLWTALLHDVGYEECKELLLRYASVNKWPPSPADIREQKTKITSNLLSDGEAWLMAKRLTRANWRGPCVKVEMNYLDADELAIKAWRILGMESIAMSENEDVTRSNFLNIYRTMEKREREEQSLPQNLRIEAMKQKYLPENNKNMLLEQSKVINNALIEANENLNKAGIGFEKKLGYLTELKNKLKNKFSSEDKTSQLCEADKEKVS